MLAARFRISHAVMLGSFACAAFAVNAQNYPAKPIRIINPYSPGGGLDVVARPLAGKMSLELGQAVIVENRPGAGGNIGVELVAKAAPDGYTLLIIQNSITINPSLQKKVPYDPVNDFAPVSQMTSYMYYLVVHPSASVRSVKQLIALAKAHPGELTYSSVGMGSGTHLSGALFSSMAGIRMTHIPYKGVGAATDVVGGQIPMTFGSTSVLPYVKAKRLVLLGVTGPRRSNYAPEAPTIAEAGLPGYDVTSWHAMFAPAGTPPAIIERLNALVRQGLTHPDAKAALDATGLEASPSTPDELGRLVKSELAKWAKVIKEAGIREE